MTYAATGGRRIGRNRGPSGTFSSPRCTTAISHDHSAGREHVVRKLDLE